MCRQESAEKVLLSRPKVNVDDLLDEDLQLARRRAERAITDDTFFDSRGAKVQQKFTQKSAQAEDDIDEEVRAFECGLLFYITVSKKKISKINPRQDKYNSFICFMHVADYI